MAWDNNALQTMVPFKAPNMSNPNAPHIGYAVTSAAFGVPDILFSFGGVNKEAENLLAASPMMYQGISRIAGAMARMIDEVEAAVDAGHVPKENVAYVIANYRAIENDCLTLMQVATNGIDETLKGLQVPNAKG